MSSICISTTHSIRVINKKSNQLLKFNYIIIFLIILELLKICHIHSIQIILLKSEFLIGFISSIVRSLSDGNEGLSSFSTNGDNTLNFIKTSINTVDYIITLILYNIFNTLSKHSCFDWRKINCCKFCSIRTLHTVLRELHNSQLQ